MDILKKGEDRIEIQKNVQRIYKVDTIIGNINQAYVLAHPVVLWLMVRMNSVFFN